MTSDAPNTPSAITAAIKQLVNDQLVKVNTTQLFDDNGGRYQFHTMVWMSREDPRRADIVKMVTNGGWLVSEWGAFFAARRPKVEREGNAAAGETFLRSTFGSKRPDAF